MTVLGPDGERLTMVFINEEWAGEPHAIPANLLEFHDLKTAFLAAVSVADARGSEYSFAEGPRTVGHPTKWLKGVWTLAWPTPQGWRYLDATELPDAGE